MLQLFENHLVEKHTFCKVCSNFDMKHHFLLHDSLANKPYSKLSNCKTSNHQGTRHVVVDPFYFKSDDKTLDNFVNLGNGNYQTMLLRSTATILNISMNVIGKDSKLLPYGQIVNCAPVIFQSMAFQGEQQFQLTDFVAVSNPNMSPADATKLKASAIHLNIYFNQICSLELGTIRCQFSSKLTTSIEYTANK